MYLVQALLSLPHQKKKQISVICPKIYILSTTMANINAGDYNWLQRDQYGQSYENMHITRPT